METKEKAAFAAPEETHYKDSDSLVNSQEKSAITILNQSFEEVEQEQTKSEANMYVCMSVNEILRREQQRPDPIPLWKCLWYEGELSCLFAESNLGKSIYAVQIARHIAVSRRVIYFDFELSSKQFQLRYTDDKTGDLCSFNDNFLRAEIDPDNYDCEGDMEEKLIKDIERTALQQNLSVIIIDNLTCLCAKAEKGDSAAGFMARLQRLKKKYGWSILVIAHTPKRPKWSPLSPNDLGGSRKLYDLFDTVSAIGLVGNINEGQRYVIQLKVRYGKHLYGCNNVILYHVEKQGAWLHFEEQGFSDEASLLQPLPEADPLSERVLQLHSEGKTQQQIVEIMTNEGSRISQSKVCRIIRAK